MEDHPITPAIHVMSTESVILVMNTFMRLFSVMKDVVASVIWMRLILSKDGGKISIVLRRGVFIKVELSGC
jgi:hypothetical protein